MHRFILLYFIVFAFNITQAFAHQKPSYHEAKTPKEKRIISFVQSSLKKADFVASIAKFDFNGDILDEFIVQHSCAPQNTCQYSIIALQNLDPILIGQFDAHKILISQKKTYGIHDLIVYNNDHNDYQNQTARWNPLSFSYQLD